MRAKSSASRAVLISALCFAAYACGESTSPVENVPASITLIPSDLTLNALGETEGLEATVRDALGNVVDTAVTFASSNSDVVTVGADGVVTAIGIGVTQATASVGSLSRSSEITVFQVGTAISIPSGNEQSAVVATTLAEPLVVRIADARDNGVAGLSVSFSVIAGGGEVSVDSVTTGADGSASTVWTLGTTAGAVHRLIAAVGGVGQTEFTAIGLADEPVAAVITAGNGQIQPVGATLLAALTVMVSDQFGNGVAGQDVLFAVTGGGGSVTPASAPTDELGEVRAQWTLGAALGAQTLEAEVPGIITDPLDFSAEGTDLTVTGLSLPTLVEGQVVRVAGTGFDTNTDNITVTVDGAASQVTAATDTTIDFVVPGTQCLPARDVDVVVTTTSGGTAPALSSPLMPLEFVGLAVGEQLIVQDPADFCFQFAAEASEETYLVGVQSVSGTASALTAATVRGAVIGGASASPSTWAALQARSFTPRLGAADVERQERWRRHREEEASLRAAQLRDLSASRRTRRDEPLAATRTRIPPDVEVGDSVTLKLPDINGNICTESSTINGLVRAVGARGIWVGDVANPSNGFSNQNYQDLSDMLDDVIFDADTAQFGRLTDLDENDRLIILVTKGINEARDFVLGFASPSDMRPASQCPASNEAEIYYSKSPDPNGTVGAFPYTRDAAVKDAPPLIAHELAHIIQAGHRIVINDAQFMAIFMAEGQATLAEEVAGHAALGNSPGRNYGPIIALNLNDDDQNDWYDMAFGDIARYFGGNTANPNESISGAPHACSWLTGDAFPCEGTGRPLWYGVTWSLLRWVNDQFGPGFPGGGAGIQQAIIDNDRVGLANLSNVVNMPIDSLLAQWSATLYMDDRVSGLPARLTFPSWNLVGILERAGPGPSALLVPKDITFSEFLELVDVRTASTAYFLLGGSDRPATAVRVRDATDNELPGSMQAYIVRVR